MSTDELPQVVGDLDPEREIVRLGTGRQPAVHLVGNVAHCDVLPTNARPRKARVEFDGRAICRDCARGEARES
jgi:hypothetical protein